MRLIGMLDSPYVRRVAISLKLLELPHSHDQLSVFRSMPEFAAINPVIKAPTLVADDGTMLMDSGLILDHVERRAGRSLMPRDDAGHLRALHLLGLALAACEKNVQIVYERGQRPADKQHQPWLDRVSGQMQAAWRALETKAVKSKGWLFGGDILQPDITIAVAWRFGQYTVPEILKPADYPGVVALSARAEALPAFLETGYS
jgi:glutathione S-transferase